MNEQRRPVGKITAKIGKDRVELYTLWPGTRDGQIGVTPRKPYSDIPGIAKIVMTDGREITMTDGRAQSRGERVFFDLWFDGPKRRQGTSEATHEKSTGEADGDGVTDDVPF